MDSPAGKRGTYPTSIKLVAPRRTFPTPGLAPGRPRRDPRNRPQGTRAGQAMGVPMPTPAASRPGTTRTPGGPGRARARPGPTGRVPTAAPSLVLGYATLLFASLIAIDAVFVAACIVERFTCRYRSVTEVSL